MGNYGLSLNKLLNHSVGYSLGIDLILRLKTELASEIVIVHYSTLFATWLMKPRLAYTASDPWVNVFRCILAYVTDGTLHC